MPNDRMTTRARFQALMNFKPFDRLPVIEWASWWSETLDRWRAEGLPDGCDLCSFFGQDVYRQDWIAFQAASCPKPAHFGAGLISTLSEYEALRERLFPWPAVNRSTWESWAREQERGEAVLWFTLDGFFWWPRKLLGIERHLYAFFDSPELIHRINSDLAEHQLRVIDEICRICKPDFMTFAEDLSYNHGPMLSKGLFDESLRPYYDQVVPRLKAYGILPIIDSDGDVAEPAYWFEESGLEGILPLERQAGVDIARLRADHPRMRFIGHFDKMVMNKGEAALRAEFERLLPTAALGGFIISCDHQTPPGVSLTDYELYMRLFREYAEEAGRMSRQNGEKEWASAFVI
jgi:hypothetical protein